MKRGAWNCLAVAEDRAVEMEAFQRAAGQVAAKLESAKSDLKESQSRVYTLTEVHLLSFVTVSLRGLLLLLYRMKYAIRIG